VALMPDNSNGPSTGTLVLIAVLATPVILVLIFWLVGSGSADAKAKLPDVRQKGLQWAVAQVKDAGFDNIETHDALGRDRHWVNDKDWKVCFEVPGPGPTDAKTQIQLGVVKTDETCPKTDQGRYEPATTTMPNLVTKTAYMTTQILGKNASISFLQESNGNEVKHNLGDWQVCSQSPTPGQRFDGVPVTTVVVKYGASC
jgi:hypothetical protein